MRLRVGRARAEPPETASLSRVGPIASIVFLGVFPVLAVVALFASAVEADSIATDFRQYYRAAETILAGDSPYLPSGPPLTEWGGPYPYPPLPALLATPLTLVSLESAGALVMAVLVAVALAIPFVLGVRDWRCYGLLLLWPPVISAIQTANVTLWLVLACAIAWRLRDRALPVALAIGLALATKFLLWPLVAWLAATKRWLAALMACVLGAGLLVLSWSVLGFAGFLDYPDLLRRLEDVVGDDSYTAYIVALDMGLPSDAARSLWLALGLALVTWTVLLGRRGDERSAFIVAVAASLALSPIVWLHYFAVLLLVAGLAQPRLGVVWFVPLGMVITPGSGHPTPFETAWTLAVAVLMIVLALRASAASRSAEIAFLAPHEARA